MNLIMLTFTLGIGLSFFVVPRKFAMLPMIASVCFVPLGEQNLIVGLNFNSMRIVILFGWISLFSRGELSSSIGFNIIDKLIITYVCVGFIAYNLLWQTSGAFVNQLGFLYNVVGTYFLCRFLIKDTEDIERTIKLLALCLIPLAVFMVVEMFTGRNMFASLGGVPEVSAIRDGYVRAQGPFQHTILAGTVGAVSMPLFVSMLAKEAFRKFWLIAGIVASTAIVLASHSSGPLLAYVAALIGLLSWICKGYMRVIRWGILLSLVSLHLVMNAPVWHLLSRIGGLTGGGGWHRAYLIDQAISHFNDWWLIGIKQTGDWMPYQLEIDPTLSDITNHYIAQGVSGGLPKMLLFIAIIVICFKTVGQNMRISERKRSFLPFQAWGIGVCLLSHVVSFVSVSYFDQLNVFWYMLLAFFAILKSQEKSKPSNIFVGYSSA
jgi:hypothetical protein